MLSDYGYQVPPSSKRSMKFGHGPYVAEEGIDRKSSVHGVRTSIVDENPFALSNQSLSSGPIYDHKSISGKKIVKFRMLSSVF